MVRALLQGDTDYVDETGLQVLLSDMPVDVSGEVTPDGTSWMPTLDIRLRSRTGFDDDGVPEFSWQTIASAPALLWQEREELDPEAGVTVVRSTATVRNDSGLESVPESAVVVDSVSGRMWRVTRSAVLFDRIELDLDRLETAETTGGTPDPPVEVGGVMTGHGEPPSSLVAGEDTLYLDLDSGWMYQMRNGGWEFMGSLHGAVDEVVGADTITVGDTPPEDPILHDVWIDTN